MRIRVSLFAVLCFTSSLAAFRVSATEAAPAGPLHRLVSHAEAPVLRFEPQAVAVTGLTPKAEAVLFIVDRQPMPYDVSVRNQTMVLRADERGTVRFGLKKPIAGRATVAVVDGTSGRYAIESPGEAPLRIRHFPPDALKKHNAEYAFADLDLTWVEAVCVRPGRGAWQLFVLDGGGLDADRLPDGRTAVAAANMKKLSGKEESPMAFHKNDVLIIVDPRTMSVMATEVAE
jgi:hypothetical protein